ncbi:MAG TPA: glycosyltransferase family 2 protein, partial [Candidatus Acidoferrales bacterium]|nr:glycosyltransferase family 2 protein [Candidatus Acidoferrales bacterium]
IVPCLNEEAALPALLDRLRAMRSRRPTRSWRFLFVDDGSTDGTFAALLRTARDESWIEVVRHHERLGLGAALRTGFAHATSPAVCTMDSGCTYPPERLPELTALLGHDAAIVTASGGYADIAAATASDPLALNRTMAPVYARLIGYDASALTCLLRAYDRRVIQRLRFRANGFSAVGEILLRALLAGYPVREVPMRGDASRADTTKLTTGDALRAHLYLLTLTTLAAGTRQIRHALGRRLS